MCSAPSINEAPAWVEWIAQDRDGSWWGYAHEPNPADAGWYENEVGEFVRLGGTAPNPDWPGTLRRVRGSG